MEKVAEKAGKAAPAVAIAGVLVTAAPQAHATVKTPAKATTVTERVRTDALVRRTAAPTASTYTVRPGDTLSAIAARFYQDPSRWQWIYQANRATISNPNIIYVGQALTIPYYAPSGTTAYTPRHASATALTSSAGRLSGTLSCPGLEALWETAGGSPAEAFMAAEIAMAESGGNQYALSPTNDHGYWQINGSHGPAEATDDAIGNARAAIAISDNGSNWYPWTTYVTGAYHGRC